TEFADIYANSNGGGGKTAIGSGVLLSAVTQQFGQGQISFTDNNLDLAISGKGFFIMSNNGSISYSRAGSFGVDKNGFIVNNTDQRLRGFLADNLGNITGAQTDLQISTATLAPKPSSAVNVNVNLDATSEPPTAPFIAGFTPVQPPDPSTYNSSTSTTIYDSLGNSHIMTSYFVKAHAENTWRVYVGIDGSDVTPVPNTPPAGVPPMPYPTGELAQPYTLVFNTSGGYIVNNPATPATYYGPGPVISTSSGLVNSGSLQPLNLNDLTLNSVAITASSSTSDGSSTTDNAASSIALAAAINQNTATHGVTASVNPNVLDLGIASFGNLAAGDFNINGVPIIGVNANETDLLNLINAQTATTGVVGAQPGGAGTNIILTTNDSRNIQLIT
ncbi:MAG TPA: flagellar hook-basal body complex protein, partial [Candidatus Berkiella sp.]|nr:flagellar hook-basal body complex protein [Candidatus Berkiella sp.]